jgi:hypothetical protein
MRITLITTTIHVPELLNEYARKFSSKNDKLNFIIAGDRKTPDLSGFCEGIESKFGIQAECLTLKAEEELSEGLYKHIPLDSVPRRNFAILKAYRDNADVIITIDDDNLIQDPSYYDFHSIVAKGPVNVNEVSSSSGWFNVCRLLTEASGRTFYHRGFPINQRAEESKASITAKSTKKKVTMSEGMWFGAPDTDAISWLAHGNIDVNGVHSDFGNQFALAEGTWCSTNSQNTAMARESIPAYFLQPTAGRYDDIWAGYVFRKIADTLGHAVVYGEPMVRQDRNAHDYTVDLRKEVDGMEQTPGLVDQLRKTRLEGKTYKDCTYELIEKIRPTTKMIDEFKTGYSKWLEAIED